MVNNLKKILKYSLIILLIFSISIFSVPISNVYKSNNLEFYDVNGNLIKEEIHNKESKYIHLSELPEYTINAFVDFEDKNFFNHHGFDFSRIISSLFSNIKNQKIISGASTITQQYARTIFLNNEKSIIRKIKEAFYTIKLEYKYTKDEILEGYLNNIYLGHGCYGIECASHLYFNKSSKDLTLSESALLASLPSSPNNSSPINNYKKAIQRKNLVLKAMLKQHHISDVEYKKEMQVEPKIVQSSENLSNIEFYLDEIKSELKSLNISDIKGLKIYTNLNLELYQKVNAITSKYTNKNDELSLLILENNTNKILVNLGSYEYSKSNYNRALYSKRQIGSTIKSFLFSFAIENGLNFDTLLYSKPTTFNIKNYGLYTPTNYNNTYAYEQINMIEAFAVSDNIYASKLLFLLGSNNFVEYLKKFNLITNKSIPSLALGTCEFTLLELTQAYSVFANDGKYYNYSFIDKIYDGYSNLLYKSNKQSSIALDHKTSNTMQKLLLAPFSNENYYTNSTMGKYYIKSMYGKTGSTTHDSYVIAYSNKYTIGIRVGVDDINDKLIHYSTPKKILKEISKII